MNNNTITATNVADAITRMVRQFCQSHGLEANMSNVRQVARAVEAVSNASTDPYMEVYFVLSSSPFDGSFALDTLDMMLGDSDRIAALVQTVLDPFLLSSDFNMATAELWYLRHGHDDEYIIEEKALF